MAVLLVDLFWPPRIRIFRRLGGLVALGAISVWAMRTQLQTPVEAIHFFEYGVLGVLLFRAWRHHVGDPLIYPIALLGVALVAWADEFLQWLTPGRFWDFLDIRLNVLAGALFLAFIARGMRPSQIQRPVARRSVRRLCGLAWLMLFLLGVSISTTPARVDRVAARIPVLGYLYGKESTMNEFGHRHVDPEIGTFFSRMTLEELRQADRGRGAEAGGILARERTLARTMEFQRKYPVSADPFLHELWSHWIRRNHFHATCWKYRESDPERFVDHLTVAWRENQILETYFPNALDAAGGRWKAAQAAAFAAHADGAAPYVSAVGRHMVTAATEMELWLVLLALAGVVGWGYVRFGRE
ncbi:MAG: VanZ family protein [Kiritimatiellia bacterium]